MSDAIKALMTYDDEHILYYFKPVLRPDPPYHKQILVEAIVDVARDGTFAGVEIIDSKMPRYRAR